MTIINRSRSFIFVHVPKTAGTAVTDHLRPYAQERDLYVLDRRDNCRIGSASHKPLHKHSTAAEIQEMLRPDGFEDFFKFSVVRNPFARAISTFLFLKFKFRNWPKSELMDEFDAPDTFVTSKFFQAPGPGGIFRPQVFWLVDHKGALLMDYMCKIETLEQGMAHVRQILSLGTTRPGVRRLNVSAAPANDRGTRLSSGAAIDIIRRRYAQDFDLLDYGRDPEKALIVACD